MESEKNFEQTLVTTPNIFAFNKRVFCEKIWNIPNTTLYFNIFLFFHQRNMERFHARCMEIGISPEAVFDKKQHNYNFNFYDMEHCGKTLHYITYTSLRRSSNKIYIIHAKKHLSIDRIILPAKFKTQSSKFTTKSWRKKKHYIYRNKINATWMLNSMNKTWKSVSSTKKVHWNNSKVWSYLVYNLQQIICII